MAIEALSRIQGTGFVVLCEAHRKQPEGLLGALRLGENLSLACGLGLLSLLSSKELPPPEPSLHVR